MTITIEATYENGVLKPLQPLPLKENEKVRISIQSEPSPLADAYGIMGFKGTAEEADYFALDPELDGLDD
jgi:predicted DNA-binding antitoxin AbrB/MazE fold protein